MRYMNVVGRLRAVWKAVVVALLSATLAACMANDGPGGGVMGELPKRAIRALADRPNVTGRMVGAETVVVFCEPHNLDSCTVHQFPASTSSTLRLPRRIQGVDYLITLSLEALPGVVPALTYRMAEQFRSDYPNAELKDFQGQLSVDPEKPAEVRYGGVRIFVLSAKARELVLSRAGSS